MHDVPEYETDRLQVQARLDAGRSRSERNKMGQYPTPPDLARDVVAHSLQLLPGKRGVRHVDIEVPPKVADGCPMAWIELWDVCELLPVALRRLASGERFGGGRVMQSIAMVHAADDRHVMHHPGGVGLSLIHI